MIGSNVNSPAARRVVITDADFDRLNHLAESARYRATHFALVTGLKGEIDRGEIVATARVPRNVVTMNSRVRLRDLGTGECETHTLVYPEAADLELGKLSVLAPLGTALLGSRTGEVIEFDTPGGVRRLKVERVLYQPEAAGDYHL